MTSLIASPAWLNAWYPVFYLEDLDRRHPQKFTLLDQDLVIWWDGDRWRAMADQCPHRLAALSEGRIDAQGHLECPYHGWSFNGVGECQNLPFCDPAKDDRHNPRAWVRTFPTAEAQGLLFVFAGEIAQADQVPLPLIDALDGSDPAWVSTDTFRDLPYDATTLLENIADVAHVPYTHHKTLSKRTNAAPMELEVTEQGSWGFKGVWAEGPRRGQLGSQYTTYQAPQLIYHDLDSEKLGRVLTVVYATPMKKGQCRAFARFPFRFKSSLPPLLIKLVPRWYRHRGQNLILEDDQIFLHHQERYLEERQDRPYGQVCYMPGGPDRFVIAFRQWVKQQGEPFPGQTFGEPLPREILLERYHSHTKNCAACGRALHVCQNLQTGAIALGLGGAILALAGVKLLGLGMAITAIALWWGLQSFMVAFHRGPLHPPRNDA